MLVAGCALVTVSGAGPEQSEGSPLGSAVTVESSPAPEGSAQPYLSVDRTGRVRLSWLARREGGGHRFQFAEFQGSD
ncbi:MAG TPA: hypothetical protein VFO19_02385, partial [Vicinamibacterales bacterium]|nr:hypothetical protein [Vicinamibacterales bacterium]